MLLSSWVANFPLFQSSRILSFKHYLFHFPHFNIYMISVRWPCKLWVSFCWFFLHFPHTHMSAGLSLQIEACKTEIWIHNLHVFCKVARSIFNYFYFRSQNSFWTRNRFLLNECFFLSCFTTCFNPKDTHLPFLSYISLYHHR